jgi:hypothetical protein
MIPIEEGKRLSCLRNVMTLCDFMYHVYFEAKDNAVKRQVKFNNLWLFWLECNVYACELSFHTCHVNTVSAVLTS